MIEILGVFFSLLFAAVNLFPFPPLLVVLSEGSSNVLRFNIIIHRPSSKVSYDIVDVELVEFSHYGCVVWPHVT